MGRPYEIGARGPDSFDCWGLLVEVYRAQFGIDLPNLNGITASAALTISREIDLQSREEWEEVERPFDGAAVAMSQRKAFHHVGVFVIADSPRILHAMEGDRVILETVRSLRSRGFRRISYFRNKKWPT